MKANAVRLPESVVAAVEWIRLHEGSETSDALRRLVRLGLERDLADRYRRGNVGLREVAEILGRPPREVLKLLWELGVPGNVTAAQALDSLRTGQAQRRKTGPRPARRKALL